MINRTTKLKQPLFQHIYLLADELSQANHRFMQSKAAPKSNDSHLCKPMHPYRADPN